MISLAGVRLLFAPSHIITDVRRSAKTHQQPTTQNNVSDASSSTRSLLYTSCPQTILNHAVSSRHYVDCRRIASSIIR